MGYCAFANTATVSGLAEWALKAHEEHREASLHDRQTFEGFTMDGKSRTM
jgi:hypothetical protein